jgi:glycosyltransferase involved in cell wall biosynthesis
VLLVGPGIMPIPSVGWGAVETVIWQQKVHLEELGHAVDILNTRGLRAALAARPWSYDLVHLHYDELVPLWNVLARRYGFPLVVTTHYGYAAWPERWEPPFARLATELCRAPGHLVLTPQIGAVLRGAGARGWIGVLPNGTETQRIRFDPGGGDGSAICLGKIEPRKRQAELAAAFAAARVRCDFAGPVIDPAFSPDGTYARHVGAWTRDEVHDRLTGYSVLVLASRGEAHPLVVLEAMSAGLSLVITREAAANLPEDAGWIHVIEDVGDDVGETVARAARENRDHRRDIRRYAEEHCDWSQIARRYVELAHDAVGAIA